MPDQRPRRWLALFGPGLLVAATGVGAGDLAIAGLAASKMGYAILWAIVVGAVVKFVVTEGLARWQLATGQTLIEGVRRRLGPLPLILLLVYLVAWCYFVGAALVKACGVATEAILPFPSDLSVFETTQSAGRFVYGAVISLVGLAVALLGGFKMFERVMGACIAIMFITAITGAALMRPDWAGVARGLVVPTIPEGHVSWILALMGGVGGTVTVLAYGYWIREAGRDRPEHLATMRIDLGVGYAATALFGISIAIIAADIRLSGSGTGLIIELADRLGATLGHAVRIVFLLGVWATMVSSLLGVWQSAPSIIADVLDQLRPATGQRDTTRRARYRVPLVLIAVVPLLGQGVSFAEVQRTYALVGVAFIPLLAVVVLILTSRRAWIGGTLRSGPYAVTALLLTLLATIVFAVQSALDKLP